MSTLIAEHGYQDKLKLEQQAVTDKTTAAASETTAVDNALTDQQTAISREFSIEAGLAKAAGVAIGNNQITGMVKGLRPASRATSPS